MRFFHLSLGQGTPNLSIKRLVRPKRTSIRVLLLGLAIAVAASSVRAADQETSDYPSTYTWIKKEAQVYIHVRGAGMRGGFFFVVRNDITTGPMVGPTQADSNGNFVYDDTTPRTYAWSSSNTANWSDVRCGWAGYTDGTPLTVVSSTGRWLSNSYQRDPVPISPRPTAANRIDVWVYLGTAAPPSLGATKCNDDKSGGNEESCSTCNRGMARYSVHSMLASLNIVDSPIGYQPPIGPAVNFTVTYNQRDASGGVLNYSNLGSKWTFNWLAYVVDDPSAHGTSTANLYVPGGGIETYSYDPVAQSFSRDPQSHALLVYLTNPERYERRLSDGSKQVFAASDAAASFPRRLFMTKWYDAAGNFASLSYDSMLRITGIVDALNQTTTLQYNEAGDPFKISKVVEPFITGRFASFSYTNGLLTMVTDTIGIQSAMGYESGTDFVNALTTPYGTTSFSRGEAGTNRWIESTDPMGGKERVEYRDGAPGISASEVAAPAGMTNSGLDLANTFFWDKKATQMYPSVNGVYDYTKARIKHWAYNTDGSVSGIIASEKAPLENRIWYAYGGQSDTNHIATDASPIRKARILDDATTQSSQYEYNTLGQMTKSTDPMGRVMSYDYDSANSIDLLTVRQTTGTNNELLRTLTYNSLHQPLTDKDAAGQMTSYTYNSFGQIRTVTNARNETITYAYDRDQDNDGVTDGYLLSITSPTFNGANAVTSFDYDDAKRVHTITKDPDNYKVTTDYDNLDRPITVTYSDTPQTTQQFEYTQDFLDGRGLQKILEVTRSKDRRGRWTTRHYNRNRQMDSMTEPYGTNSTITTLYNWCTCGSLTSIEDPRHKTTSFNRDLESRVTSKVFADTTSTTYIYENTTSRVQSMTDALNRRTNYLYFADDSLQQVSYTDTAGHALTPPTPTVAFAYDPNYNRPTSMIDGTGTTSYSYVPVTTPPGFGAGQLYTTDGPLQNDTITYAYDELGRVTSRSVNGVSSTVSYDSLGRLNTSDNVLGHFSRVYDGTGQATSRLKTLNYPNGQSANYSYFDNANDRRLQTIDDHTSTGLNISRSDYTYDSENQIQTWAKQLGRSSTITSTYTSDLADQLTGASNATAGGGTTTLSYSYDDARNRTGDNAVAQYTIGDVNEITNASYTYDLAGNMTSDGVRSFEWDAANRLTAIVYPGDGGRSEFTYDGLSRRTKITEKNDSGITLKTSNFIWDGTNIAEERNGSNVVIKRFLEQGMQVPAQVSPNAKLYYSRDHLGSIRSLTNENGTLLSTLDYDPYGSISRAPVPANDTSGSGPKLIGAVSRMTHRTSGSFDINLALSGAPSIEMRLGAGSGGNYTVVLTFDGAVSAATSASVASGVGSVSGLPTFLGNTATVQLGGVADRQTITVELDNVVGGGGTTAKVFVAMSILIGDVNQDGAVTATDVRLIQDSTRQEPDSSTFTCDINATGWIDGNDVSLGTGSQNQGAALYPDFSYTGHYYHSRSGLYLTLYRVYNPSLGRWLSRDPIGEQGGLNLYNYVDNNPLRLSDPLGLWSAECIRAVLDAVRQATKLVNEWAKFDPFLDQVGWPNRWGMGSPGGHRKELVNLQNGLRQKIRTAYAACKDDCDGGGKAPIPGWVRDVAFRPIPLPWNDELLSRVPGSDAAWSRAGNVSLGVAASAGIVASGGALAAGLGGEGLIGLAAAGGL